MTWGSMSTGDVLALPALLSDLSPAADDAERIDRIRALEEVKGAVAAAQAAETAAFAASQQAAQRAARLPADRVGRGVAAQIALARRESPFRAQRYVGWCTILTRELPVTLSALRRGETSEWRAMIVARETAWLSAPDRATVDAQMGPRLGAMGDRQVEAATKQAAYRADPDGYVDRLRAAERDRRVSLRPAPDTMARLGALLPVAQGVATYTALGRQADAARAAGDHRSRGQIMADTLVERVTGQAAAAAVPVEVELVMTDQALLADEEVSGVATDEPAVVLGYGPVPARWARELLHDLPASTPAWIRRLYRHPRTGRLAAMDAQRRLFTAAQRRFVRIRDHDTCRTPYCGAPIRHIDHVVAVEHGGRTEVSNSEGLCEACNYAKQAPGWSSRAAPGGSITVTTPTGHTYAHDPPQVPGQEATEELTRRIEALRRSGRVAPAA